MDLKEIKKISLYDICDTLAIPVNENGFIHCINPNHLDFNPSCSINGPENCFKCFSCGLHGSNIDFVMIVLEKSFQEAVKWFENGNVGRRTIRKKFNPIDMAKNVDRNTPYIPTPPQKILTDFIKKCGPISEESKQYLLNRGIPLEIIKNKRITDIKNYNRASIYLLSIWSLEELKKVGLFNDNGYFVFLKHKLLFPFIKDDEVYWIQARTLEKDIVPPYKNIRSPLLFPYNCEIMNNPDVKEICITESVIDCISLELMGKYAIGIPGVQHFKKEWVDKFRDFETVVVAFDNDDPGLRASIELKKKFLDKKILVEIHSPQNPYKDWNDVLKDNP